MATRADELIDRRRLRRKLSFWRVLTLLVAAAGIAGVAWSTMRGDLGRVAADHIAKVKIEGTITEDEDLLKRLDDVRRADAVRGVILVIDSPGGTTAGGEATFEAVRRLAAEKPVVAQVGTLAASAGYMVASAADHIVARQSSIVGSIGVLVQFPNFSGLMDRMGISMDEVKSSPLKAEPSPFNATTEEEKAMLRAMIMDSYDWFVGLVDDRRPLNREEVLALADGSVFTGRQALQRKLVDELGGEDTAKRWLVSKGVNDGLRVREWKPADSGRGWFLMRALSAALTLLGLPQDAAGLLPATGADRLFLDGLLSVWHPETGALPD